MLNVDIIILIFNYSLQVERALTELSAISFTILR